MGDVNAPVLNVESFTVEVWARRLGNLPPGQNEHHLFQLRDFVFNQSFTVTLVVGPDPGKRDTIFYDLIDDFGFRANGSTGHATANESIFGDFHQYVFNFNNSNGELALRVDGGASPVFSVTNNIVFNQGDAMEIFVIGLPNELGRRFQGDISVFRAYDRLLTPAEIAANFAHGPSACDTPTPLPVVGSSLVTVSNALEVAFDSESGTDYIVQVASNLVEDVWVDQGPTVNGTGASLLLYHPTGAQNDESVRVVRK